MARPPFYETYEKCSFFSRSRKAKILTTPVRSARTTGQAGIHGVFRGLKSEQDTEIGQISAGFEKCRFEVCAYLQRSQCIPLNFPLLRSQKGNSHHYHSFKNDQL